MPAHPLPHTRRLASCPPPHPPLQGVTPLTELSLAKNRISGALPSELGQLTNLRVLELDGNERLGTPVPNWQVTGNYSVSFYSGTFETPPMIVSREWGTPGGEEYGYEIVGTRQYSEAVLRSQYSAVLDSPNTTTASLVAMATAQNVTPSTFTRPRYSLFDGLLGVAGIPTEIGMLSHMRWLRLGHTSLNGTIPIQLSNLTSLQSLYLPTAKLSGTLPSELGKLRSLELLNLAGNEISGVLIPELGELHGVRVLDLEANPLSGSIPNETFASFNGLEYWSTFGCNLTGHLPSSVKRVAERRTNFEFFVQDEQLELLYDYRCRRDEFIKQREYPNQISGDGRRFKGNFARELISTST